MYASDLIFALTTSKGSLIQIEKKRRQTGRSDGLNQAKRQMKVETDKQKNMQVIKQGIS